MLRRYVTVDVFTNRIFAGNPVAVVLDAQGLSTRQMQALATEFGYSETTFVLPPADPGHTAQVRIFTPDREIPFAGHPNLGTAYALADDMTARGIPVPDIFTFEEIAGKVPIELWRQDGRVVGAELRAPEPLSCRAQVRAAQAAACLSLKEPDIRIDAHAPRVVSVGLPFLVVQLASRDALARIQPDRAAYSRVLPLDGAHSIYAYALDGARGAPDVHARMFTGRMTEDPATGSATGAMACLLARLRGLEDLDLLVAQGDDVRRPSRLHVRARAQDGAWHAHVGGHCVSALNGTLALDGEIDQAPLAMA
ncbi:PhzF family phenazine biosynthesis protein [Achromobacter aloeverae]|uniref:PhzF family phenazine biosynthesis protein n=1 Tax=Achromobacter aloeverae TaxID=1750518 RepID=A0A4Q1HEU9_9BURK|nr:PhzF family phenazine biosynthesis protein [Achromobacter aloeverae]RXN85140.1 PhzF family phenazine biosynthesis protein [Achromobacter aloeverae]